LVLGIGTEKAFKSGVALIVADASRFDVAGSDALCVIRGSAAALFFFDKGFFFSRRDRQKVKYVMREQVVKIGSIFSFFNRKVV